MAGACMEGWELLELVRALSCEWKRSIAVLICDCCVLIVTNTSKCVGFSNPFEHFGITITNQTILYISCGLNERNPGARFSKVSKSRSKISNLMITAPFYSHILDINRGSFHTSFRRVNLSVARYREIKNGFTGLKSFRDFRGTGPGSPWRGTAHFLIIILHSDSILAPGTRVDKST